MMLVRSAMYNVYFITVTVAYGLAGVWARLFAPERGLAVAQDWTRALLAGVRVICGIRYQVIGRENLVDGPMLIASQHQSAFDTLVWMLLVPEVSYVFKAELARVPLVGPMLLLAGQIPVDRAASKESMRRLLRGAEGAVAAGRVIVIFPEGTRVAPGVDAPLRSGVATLARRTGLPITPVATDSGKLWGRRAFRKRPGVIHLVIGPPLRPVGPQAEVMGALRQAWAVGTRQIPACG